MGGILRKMGCIGPQDNDVGSNSSFMTGGVKEEEPKFELITPIADINELFNFERIDIWAGGLSTVKSATTKIRGYQEIFAIKTLRNDTIRKTEFNSIRNEVEMIYKLDHPHIVKLYNAYTDHTFTYLVLEKCKDEIGLQNTISEELARNLSYKLLLALAYLHDRSICHLDIKPKNILATSTELKLIDFGYACDITKEIDFVPRGTPEFFAPEILGKLASTSCDMWSFGITLFNWLTGDVPYTGKGEEIYNKARIRPLTFESGIWNNISNDCKDLLKKVIVFDPNYRLTAQQALNHAWFNCIPKHIGIEMTTLTKLRKYQTTSKALRVCMRILAYCSKPQNLAALTEKFLALDPAHSGAITAQGLRSLLSLETATDTELEQIVEKFDCPKTAYSPIYQITFSDFIAAMQSTDLLINNEGPIIFSFKILDIEMEKLITAYNLIFRSELSGLYIDFEEVKSSMPQQKVDETLFSQMLYKLRHSQGGGHDSSTESENIAVQTVANQQNIYK